MGGLLANSTRAWLKEAQDLPDYSAFDMLHGYIYSRWPYFYISMAVGTHPMAKRLAPMLEWAGNLITRQAGDGKEAGKSVKFEDTYHGKVVPPDAARQLVSVKEDIEFRNLEHILPYTRARDLVMKNPDHIVALDCPCRLAREDPCLPLDVCLIIGEPFASFMMEHQPNHSRWISSQEAQEILKAEHERGHVHHAFFKDAMLGRFYAICNCCPCCCGAFQAQRSGTLMLCSSGYVAQVDESRCLACGTCAEACPFDAIEVHEFAQVKFDTCMGCGVCVDQCNQEGIHLERAAEKGEPLELRSLIEADGI